jgi:ribonucleoside-triphosphate reductase
MTAGPALERENMAGFNCSYVAIDRPTAFDEVLYILMNGTGVGYSVESKYVNKLPYVAEAFTKSDTVIVVPDSKLGWAKATRELIALLYAGQIPSWDVSKLRPAGAPLKTFGGRASGPEPLVSCFRFAVELFKRNAGRKLSTLDCHDLVCKIADTIVVGGVRRSALICLSDLNDDLMRMAKSGRWYDEHPHRAFANISYVSADQPPIGLFMKEWLSLYESRSGERGIFSRLAAQKQAKKTGRRDPEQDFGTNPCSEIILRNREVCNLTEVVVRAEDDFASLRRKIELATILGTWQSTLVNFNYLPAAWKKNIIEERLLGVSLTGIYDNPLTYTNNGALEAMLTVLKNDAIDTNKKWAKKLDINQSALSRASSRRGPSHSLWTPRRVFIHDIPSTIFEQCAWTRKTQCPS